MSFMGRWKIIMPQNDNLRLKFMDDYGITLAATCAHASLKS